MIAHSTHSRAHESKKIPRSDFQPAREYIENAVMEFLRSGGKITRIEVMPTINTEGSSGLLQESLFDEFDHNY